MPVYEDGERAGLPRPLARNAAMEAVYGAAGEAHLVTVVLPGINRRAAVHAYAAEAFQQVFADIDKAGLTGLIATYDGTYNYRTVRGSSALSPHSWGVAVDLNSQRIMSGGKEVSSDSGNFHCTRAQIPDSCRRLAPYFHARGFSWGGDWNPEYLDPMHYEATDLTFALLRGTTCEGMDAWRKRMAAAQGASGTVQRAWQFTATQDPNGHILAQGIATRWADHETFSGTPADTPGLIACSLPRGLDSAGRTAGSPFERFGIQDYWLVLVYNPATKLSVIAPVIDEGPGYSAQAGTGKAGSAMIDLTPAAWLALGLRDNGLVHIRILPGTAEDGKRLCLGGGRVPARLVGPDGREISGAYVESGQLRGPVAAVAGALGGKVLWDNKAKAGTLQKAG